MSLATNNDHAAARDIMTTTTTTIVVTPPPNKDVEDDLPLSPTAHERQQLQTQQQQSYSTTRKPPDVSSSSSSSSSSYTRLWIGLFLLLQVVICLVFSVSVHYYLRDGEKDVFHETYYAQSSAVMELFERRLQQKVWMTYSISSSIYALVSLRSSSSSSSSATATTTTTAWPNVIVPNLDLQTRAAIHLTSSQSVSLSPVVFNETIRQEWYNYIVANAPKLLSNNSTAFATVLCPTHPNNNSSSSTSICRSIQQGMYRFNQNGQPMNETGTGPYCPVLQVSPPTLSADQNYSYDRLLWNQLSDPTRKATIKTVLQTFAPALTGFLPLEATATTTTTTTAAAATAEQSSSPRSILFYPLLDGPHTDNKNQSSVFFKSVGVLGLEFAWTNHLIGHEGRALTVVLTRNDNGEQHTFELSSAGTIYVGKGDHHDGAYGGDLQVGKPLPVYGNQSPLFAQDSSSSSSLALEEQLEGNAEFMIHIYPTADYADEFYSNRPVVAAFLVALVFILIGIQFCAYLGYRRGKQGQEEPVELRFPQPASRRPSFHAGGAERRPSLSALQDMAAAATTPGGWKQKLRRVSRTEDMLTPRVIEPAQARLRAYLTDSGHTPVLADIVGMNRDEPIAEMFPETTVMFADIQGFTAWTSEREPQQIFLLLETLYRAFDEQASKLGVFKVDTIGDCYVAVSGLPDPNKYHAVLMAQYANECMLRMDELIKDLEVTLGPGTADLSMRFGLHSGPVTAGVLRGEKSRFQLFGDTVNTAARMEHTGMPNRIHLSDDTAQILISSGKSHWLSPRDKAVSIKGKGAVQTYWLNPPHRGSSMSSLTDQTASSQEDTFPGPEQPRSQTRTEKWGQINIGTTDGFDTHKQNRLVGWNCEVLGDLLSKVVTWRVSREVRQRTSRRDSVDSTDELVPLELPEDHTVIDEVTEVVTLPRFDENALNSAFTEAPPLSAEVREQLHDYITCIANMYHNVPFHNLEHASHVTLSAHKLMKRIISPGETDFKHQGENTPPRRVGVPRRRLSFGKTSSAGPEETKIKSVQRSLHESTFGISSDPLTQFAIVFSALIHDVDHTGLPNVQLVKEEQEIAIKYHNKSVAEQNSVDIAWNLLMEPQYQGLRQCIFGNDAERNRFRQLVVNSVMATDIVDKELKQLRNNRWDKAFDDSIISEPASIQDVNRKATIVIEHIIQASDVAHTMQHWHVYCKWNQMLFHEMYIAYLTGRAQKDPSLGWYEGEIWFFDNYIIPLAKKLKECGVFGVSSDEYLSYALENRREWEMKGKVVCQTMMMSFKQAYPVLVHSMTRRGSGYSSTAEGSRGDMTRRDSNLSYSDVSA